jgi:hypothetical protein
MKIALFYPRNIYASWYALGGYVEALTRMGHEVLDAPVPGNVIVPGVQHPTIDALNSCDAILSMYHEYMQPWLEAFYGLETWSKLKPPVIARFDESFDRNDLLLPHRWPQLKEWAKYYFFPAHQDAKRFGGEFLPYGADTTMFHSPETAEKKYEIGFVGSMYPLRMSYLDQLSQSLPDTLTFQYGQAIVQDLSGFRAVDSTNLLAKSYSEVKIFFCLPPMSRLLVCKLFEVMSCGTFMMYPKLPGDARRNNEVFEDGKHLVYYAHGRTLDNADQIKYWLTHDEEREAIARAGQEFVHANFTLEQMLEKLLAPVQVREMQLVEKGA